jgi:hypothetical protein
VQIIDFRQQVAGVDALDRGLPASKFGFGCMVDFGPAGKLIEAEKG